MADRDLAPHWARRNEFRLRVLLGEFAPIGRTPPGYPPRSPTLFQLTVAIVIVAGLALLLIDIAFYNHLPERPAPDPEPEPELDTVPDTPE